MITRKISTSYSLRLDGDQRALVLDADLYLFLDASLPIHDIDYDGHCGPSVFYSVYEEDDNEALHLEVKRICYKRWQEIKPKIV